MNYIELLIRLTSSHRFDSWRDFYRKLALSIQRVPDIGQIAQSSIEENDGVFFTTR